MTSDLFSSDWLDSPKTICGIMTGTSLDGVNTAIATFYRDYRNKVKFELVSWDMIDLPKQFRESIFKVIYEPVHISQISLLQYSISHLYADAVFQSLNKAGKTSDEIDLIGIHGQTVWHQPQPLEFDEFMVASTLQLASTSALSKLTGIPVVGDFRSGDVALGGQGAPLVPIFDYNFLSEDNTNVIALNIGGIANVTLLPAGGKSNAVSAFDTGPGNVLIDAAASFFFNLKFDRNGDIASSGSANESLLAKLKQNVFITLKPPKSTGREEFNLKYVQLLRDEFPGVSQSDFITTLTFFTAWSIAENIRLFGDPKSRVILSGGGIHNNYLLSSLKAELPQATIISSAEVGIPPDAKEALCFAYLACLYMINQSGNIPSVTGASRESILGLLAKP